MKRTPLDRWIGTKIDRPDSSLTRSQLDAYQGQALGETVAWAQARSGFYRHLLADAPTIDGLSDLTKLPFTTADDIRREPLQLVCVSQDEIQRVVTLDTSGTTGSPKRLFFTRADQELTIDFFHQGMTTFTDPGDRVLILLPAQTPGSVGDLLATALQRFNAVPVKYGPVVDPDAVLRVIRREAINVIVGVPVHLLALVRHDPTLKIKSVLFATDHVPDPIRAELEQMWDCQTYDHYGMTEMGLGGGVECAARRGYHLREADLLFEIVDPHTGEPQPEGDYGEIVFTTLTRRGMPLIRYRTGDWGRFIPGACPCGTVLKTLERVQARVNGRFTVKGGILTLADLDRVLFGLPQVANYHAALIKGFFHDCLQLNIQARELDLLPVAAALNAHVPQVAGLEIGFREVEVIPLTMAKRVLIDNRMTNHE